LFTSQALDFASPVEDIVLIDRGRVAAPKIECELGATARAVKPPKIKIPKIDGDCIDEEPA
jgi:hypothetical protein